MKVEQLRTSVFRVTLHAVELSALVAAARWVANGAEGELTEDALAQLRKVLASYDSETRSQRDPDVSPAAGE